MKVKLFLAVLVVALALIAAPVAAQTPTPEGEEPVGEVVEAPVEAGPIPVVIVEPEEEEVEEPQLPPELQGLGEFLAIALLLFPVIAWAFERVWENAVANTVFREMSKNDVRRFLQGVYIVVILSVVAVATKTNILAMSPFAARYIDLPELQGSVLTGLILAGQTFFVHKKLK